ncbi:putative Esterase [metagenome]|uniref:Putative Esterase n=1 Tax=metagenome TaxID=256318 RepID=A0A2P2CE43_9ZZZZ
MISRRGVLAGGAGVLGLGVAAVAGWELAPDRIKQRLGVDTFFVPDAAEGQVTLEQVESTALGAEVHLFTAVPAGYGDGAGLPVVMVLHGASASAEEFRSYGFGRFVTAAVEAGAPPFVLAGTDDGPTGWVPDGSGDPQRLVTEELPAWLTERGFDADRRALWGWSRGGYGVLRLLESRPDFARAAALFSPAVVAGDPVLDDLAALAAVPLGIWCGDDDPFLDGVHELVQRLTDEPDVLTYAPGAHDRRFWNDHTLDAFAWLAPRL